MKLSEKKKQELYNVTDRVVMNLRVKQNSGLSIEEMDEELFKLQSEIWRKIKEVLNIER